MFQKLEFVLCSDVPSQFYEPVLQLILAYLKDWRWAKIKPNQMQILL